MRIEGERVYLRPLERADAEGDYPHWLNDPEVCKYNSHGERRYTKEMALDYIDMVSQSPRHRVFAVCDLKNNQHIGNISLQQISAKNRSAEFAIMIGNRSYSGKGVAKEASNLLLRFGFGDLNLHRIYCGTSVNNEPMRRLALSLGMKQEGIRIDAMIKNDKFIDVIEYGLISPDYSGVRAYS
jgi:[ribosomal protein S5]-alanine N-acetyltransferase